MSCDQDISRRTDPLVLTYYIPPQSTSLSSLMFKAQYMVKDSATIIVLEIAECTVSLPLSVRRCCLAGSLINAEATRAMS